MIKTIALVFFMTFLFSCSGGSDSPAPEENKAPEKVETLTYPTNNLLCIDNTLDFQWGASSDPNGDAITYTLEIATKSDFSDVESHTSTTTTKTVTLEKGKAYHWRVQAKDSKDLSSEYSSVYQFYTEGIGVVNHLPFSPELIAPENDSNTSDASIDLKWDASDVDDDALTYDVYFDTVNPPVSMMGDNQSEKEINVSLTVTTTYYWKVVVNDGNGGEAIGPVWSFETN
ncbi:fibronectin type III domain-containing protein [Flavivirga algicola]|uniref:Fibronectin type-III domain-containing protein n=1 Tax=Flavivirga algicola TaxID=2729136 RepID=A0ABX1RTF8_9FLAO|nr:hypothetical protein [Flavivirga algicola]NMH86836.1 hypothetical protein [Flavivirga algicola]